MRHRCRAQPSCHPEAADSHAPAGDSPTKDLCTHCGAHRIDLGRRGQKGRTLQCDKNDYRGILAGLEGVSGKRKPSTPKL
jgi:hypothetical protein